MKKNFFGENVTACLCLALLAAVVLLSGGCQTDIQPRLRLGAYFGSPTKMEFPDPENLGRHNYAHQKGEKLGMVYTCKGGFIDIGHVREAADRTAYLAGITYRNLMLKRTAFTYQVIEPSRYWVTISYPENWDQMSIEDREETARQVSIPLGQYFARNTLIWHEILTWYGFSSSGLFSENISAFSWEDTYSDLLGTCLAVRALQDQTQNYDDAMTQLIDQTLRELEVQMPEVARYAAKQIEGKWFSGGYYFFVAMKKRNFDAGLTNGQITPWLVPGICPDAQPQPCPAPGLDFLSSGGFGMELEIESQEMQRNKIYHDLHLKDIRERIRPAVHFPMILEHIKEQAQKIPRGRDKDAAE